MLIAVTGASGSIGTAFLRRCADATDWSIRAVARHVPTAAPYTGVDWVACDVGAADAVPTLTEAFTGADAVLHLAWAVHPTRDEPPQRRTDIVGTDQVLAAAAKAGVSHVVHASSVAAYRPTDRFTRVSEDAPLGGVSHNPYSLDKVAAERLLDRFAAAHPDIRVARIRPAAVLQRAAAGELARWTMSPLIPGRLLGRRWLPVPVWPGLRLQAVHADDVAEALRLILLRRATGAFNLAAEPVLTGTELASVLGGFPVTVPRALAHLLAWPTWRLGLQPMHPGWLALADSAALADADRARAELGWQPRVSARDTLVELVEGIRDSAGMPSRPLRPQPTGPRLSVRQWQP